MAYMRSPIYAWSDGEQVHLWVKPGATECYVDPEPADDYGVEGGVAISEPLFGAICLIHLGIMLDDPRETKRALKRLAKEGAGNYGPEHIWERLEPHASDVTRKRLAAVREQLASARRENIRLRIALQDAGVPLPPLSPQQENPKP